jgi:hypothetical protein
MGGVSSFGCFSRRLLGVWLALPRFLGLFGGESGARCFTSRSFTRTPVPDFVTVLLSNLGAEDLRERSRFDIDIDGNGKQEKR